MGDLYCKYCGQRLSSGLLSAYSSGSGDLGGAQYYAMGGPGGGAASDASGARQVVGRLVVRPLPGKSGGQTRETPLDGRDIAIGRSPTCDVMLEDDQLVSRRHALLRYNGSEYTIVDLGSSNGTFLNEEEIHAATSPPLRQALAWYRRPSARHCLPHHSQRRPPQWKPRRC
jgi:hypothetical protein